MELATDDIIVFNGHIAMISQVTRIYETSALCQVSESRTSQKLNGGPQTNSLWIRLDKQGKFQVDGHEYEAKAIVRLSGM